MSRGLEVRLLGPLDVRDAGRTIDLPRGRSRALLALLALEAGRAVSTQRLIDELWGTSPPATVVTALHGLVSGLRKRLEPGDDPDRIITRPPGYVLDIAPDQVDAHRFRQSVHRAPTVPPTERSSLLRDALDMWRGPALADVDPTGPAAGEAIALEELRLAAYEELFDAELSLGRHRQVVAEIEALLAAHPLRERLHGQLMLALYRSGNQSAALAVWHRARDELVEQVGVEPGPGLRRLHAAILEHDRALDLDAAEITAGDAGSREVAARAGELLAAAGSRIFSQHWDAATAQELFSRAEELLPPEHPRRRDVTDRIPETYLMLGRHRDADARLVRAVAEARERGDVERASHLLLERARIQLTVGPDPIPMTEIEAIASTALDRARAVGDDAMISQATFVLVLAELRRGRIDPMERFARLGQVAAERSGRPRERLAARWMLALALVEGPAPVADVIAECHELADLGTSIHAGVLTELARSHARQGEPDRARGFIMRARSQLERRPGMRRPTMFVAQRAAEVEVLTGHPARAEPHLRTALGLADEFGEADQRAQLAGRLAAVIAGRDQGEALELAHKSRTTAPRESVHAQVLWRTAMAVALDADRQVTAAAEIADEATALVPGRMHLLATEVRTLLSLRQRIGWPHRHRDP